MGCQPGDARCVCPSRVHPRARIRVSTGGRDPRARPTIDPRAGVLGLSPVGAHGHLGSCRFAAKGPVRNAMGAAAWSRPWELPVRRSCDPSAPGSEPVAWPPTASSSTSALYPFLEECGTRISHCPTAAPVRATPPGVDLQAAGQRRRVMTHGGRWLGAGWERHGRSGAPSRDEIRRWVAEWSSHVMSGPCCSERESATDVGSRIRTGALGGVCAWTSQAGAVLLRHP